jgi:hypothetical protein
LITRVSLNHSNIQQEIKKYLKNIDAIQFPERKGSNVDHILSLKRDPLGSGPYPTVSLFEASNRLFSDIVILFGVRQILLNPQIGSIKLPFLQYEVKFGTKGGFDIEAENGSEKLVGEAFNVARSYFPDKIRKMRAKLKNENNFDYKILIFNSDAVPDPGYYMQMSLKSMIYLPVDFQQAILEFTKNNYD